jgi:outer membrane lipoprotein-sorting protein
MIATKYEKERQMNKRQFVGTNVLIVLPLLLSLLLTGCQSGPTAEEVVAKMKEVEASIEDAHGVLEVSIQAQGMDQDVVVELWEKMPNKFRAEVLEASDSELVGTVSVTDGSQAWMYNPSKNKAIVGELSELEMEGELDPGQMIQMMEGMIQRVSDTSEVELLGEEEVSGVATYKLEFTPKEDAEETILPVGSVATLWVEQERWIVLQAHLISDMFGEGWMRVRSFEFNTGIADEQFQFEVPAGAEVTQLEDLEPTSITLDEAREQADFALLVPAYVPEGATLIDVLSVNGAFVLYYDHAETSFTVMQGTSPEMGLDRSNPQGQTTEVTVRGQAGTLITDDQGNTFLTWEEDGVTITIAGHISQDQVLQVAESLQ